MSHTTPTDNAWLDEVLIQLAKEIRHETLALGSNDPNQPVKPVFGTAKAQILAHIDTVCREAARGELEALKYFRANYTEGLFGRGLKTADGGFINNADMSLFTGEKKYIEDRLAQLNPNKDTV